VIRGDEQYLLKPELIPLLSKQLHQILDLADQKGTPEQIGAIPGTGL